MDIQAYEKIYKELTELLADNHLSWIIEQVTDELRRGIEKLKQHGFTFVGSTICYAFMQAVGLVNDHIVPCYRWQEVRTLSSG